MNKLFLEEYKVTRTLKLERWQGPPHFNKVKQNEIVFVSSVCSGIEK